MKPSWTAATALGATMLVASMHAQVGRGGSEWLTAGADAQRTSWIRVDPKISVESMAKPGFELQWSQKLDNRPRQLNGLTQGVTANGVTLFVPMSIVGGSSNNVYAIDNDTGYVVWQRRFDAAIPAAAPGCPGGMTAAATRIVPLVPPPITVPNAGGGRGVQAYRSVIGEPGQGAPLEARGRGGAAPPAAPVPSTAAAAGTAPPSAAAPPASSATAPPPGRGGGAGGGGRGNAGPGIPGAPATTGGGGFGRASGVVYVISSDGVLHVMGLPSGKDIQRPAEFMPANARWSDAIAVNTTLYTTTSGKCGGAPNGVWAIDLATEDKPVVSWKSSDDLVGAIAFATDGTLLVAKSTGLVALDSKTLQEKGAFADASLTLVTGPTLFKHNDKDIVAVATKDGRVLLLDAAALGSGPVLTSKPIVTAGSITADALATWQEMTITPPPPPDAGTTTAAAPAAAGAAPATVTLGTRWILAPVTGGVAALKLSDAGGTLSLDSGWTARNLVAPATPIVVNGVVFALSSGRPRAPAGAGTPAVLRAYEGVSGKLLWDSRTAMKSFASPGSFWSALGQIYVGTNDGTIYAFGFADERR